MNKYTNGKEVIESLLQELEDKKTEFEEIGFGTNTTSLFQNAQKKIRIFGERLINKTNQKEDMQIASIQGDIQFLRSEIAAIEIIDEPTQPEEIFL